MIQLRIPYMASVDSARTDPLARIAQGARLYAANESIPVPLEVSVPLGNTGKRIRALDH